MRLLPRCLPRPGYDGDEAVPLTEVSLKVTALSGESDGFSLALGTGRTLPGRCRVPQRDPAVSVSQGARVAGVSSSSLILWVSV